MGIVGRVIQIIDYKKISTRKFCLEIGVANGFLDKVKDVGSEKVLRILKTYPEISAEWLIAGEGEMLKSSQSNSEYKDSVLLREMLQEKDIEIKTLNREIGELQRELHNKKYSVAMDKLPTAEHLPSLSTPLIAAEPIAKYGNMPND